MSSRQFDADDHGAYGQFDVIGSVSLIIPTKNRPRDLALTVQSILEQTVLARQLIIVDQSDGNEGRQRVEELFSAASRQVQERLRLYYIYDTSINGGAAARNRAMEVAQGDIWLFLDDDVDLERDFIEQILKVYRDYPETTGVSGIITNYPPIPTASRWWKAMFVHGPFHDERQPIYRDANRLRNSAPLPVSRFGGGLMSFRAAEIGTLRFDEKLRGVCDGEDVDFCARLKKSSTLLIAPQARLVHNQSPAGRLKDHWLRREARASLFLFEKHWNRNFKNKLFAWWLCVGYGSVATVASLRRFSLEPWRALRTGIREAYEAIARDSGSSR